MPLVIEIPKINSTFIDLVVSRTKRSRHLIDNHETMAERMEVSKILLKFFNISGHPWPSTLRIKSHKRPIHWTKLPIEALMAKPTIPKFVNLTKK